MTHSSSADRYADGEYASANPGWHEEDSPWKAARITQLIREHQIEFDTCVEIGCGAGRILEALAREFPDRAFTGWDIAPGLVDRWASIDGVRFCLGDVTTTDDRYDLALSIDVFEHVEDYLGFLRACRALAHRHIFHVPLEMSVSGVLRDRQLDSRARVGHLHYFSEATAIATLVDTGYRVVDVRYTAGVLDLASAKRPLSRVANPVRRLIGAARPAWSARLLGGYSLLVLAERAS